MVDTLWADISSWQSVVDDTYPYRVLAIRSNDGTYRDPDFAANYRWSVNAMNTGRLDFLIIYMVYRPNWLDTVTTCRQMVGIPDRRTVFMIDVESWAGQIVGDQSSSINSLVDNLAAWVGDRRRVIGYGNVSDLDTLWPSKPAGLNLVVAAYGSNPGYPSKIAHQFTNGIVDKVWIPPFGYVDDNSADGLSVADLMKILGVEDSVTSPQDVVTALLNAQIPDTYPGANRTWKVSDALSFGPTNAAEARDIAEVGKENTDKILAFLTSFQATLIAAMQTAILNAVAQGVIKIELTVPPTITGTVPNAGQ
jgi:hypothetical protein